MKPMLIQHQSPKTRTCRFAKELAEQVHRGEVQEVVVPLAIRDFIRALPAGSALSWIHTPAMKVYQQELERLREESLST